VAFQSALQQTTHDKAQINAERMSTLMIAVTVLAISAAALLGWMVTASVTRPLGGEPDAVGELAQAIARGDLAHAIDDSRAGPGSVVASGASVERVDRGTDQMGQAGQAMQEIVRQVHEVSRMLADISGATVQQTSGIEQVNSAVAQLDQTTQQNAALVEQGAAAGQRLNQQAERLQQVVAVFKLS